MTNHHKEQARFYSDIQFCSGILELDLSIYLHVYIGPF